MSNLLAGFYLEADILHNQWQTIAITSAIVVEVDDTVGGPLRLGPVVLDGPIGFGFDSSILETTFD